MSRRSWLAVPPLLLASVAATGPAGEAGAEAALRFGLAARYLVDEIGIGYRERIAGDATLFV